ncbi:RICIN domain-containing protein [Streptomyces sp. NPDC050658]|uniref:RICIN domain-containing protein n=1 Tax=unclassified Streptomyces TaxID=2593676 RepID=UPI00343C8B1B
MPSALGAVLALLIALLGMPGWAAEEDGDEFASYAVTEAPPVACAKNAGARHKGIHVFYVHRAGEDRAAERAPVIRRLMWDVDQQLEAGTKRLDADQSRRYQMVQDDSCRIEVTPVGVSGLAEMPGIADIKRAMDRALMARLAPSASAEDQNKKLDAYLDGQRPMLFMDWEETEGLACGVGGGAGRAKSTGGWASVTRPCWNSYTITHELMHSFGVPHCADGEQPGHLQHGKDPLCGGGSSADGAEPKCTEANAAEMLDCVGDQFHYFHPAPEAGSALAEAPEENVANNPQLLTDVPARPVDVRLQSRTSGLCLDRGADGAVVQKECAEGNGSSTQVWRRTLDSDGYLTLRLVPDGRCLTLPSDQRPGKGEEVEAVAAVLSACAAAEPRQQWWMRDGAGPDHTDSWLVNRATRQNVGLEDGGKEKQAGTRLVQMKGGPGTFTPQFVTTLAKAGQTASCGSKSDEPKGC